MSINTIFPLRWEREYSKSNETNISNIKITAVNTHGETVIITKKFHDWIGVCTGNIEKVIKNIKKFFPTCLVKCVKLKDAHFKKVLPYFKDRLLTQKLRYSKKPFYKLYTSAVIEDVGLFFHKKKISYYEKGDWLTRIYIDFCTLQNSSEFYYKWYNVDDSKVLLTESLQLAKDCHLKPNITIAAFDLETVPLDGKNRVPTGHHESDRIVMISLVKWNHQTKKKFIMYYNPIGEPLHIADTLEYFSESDMLVAFHSLIQDVHVLTGYNINNFDLPCLFARLTWLNQSLDQYFSRKIGNYLVPTIENKLVIDMYNFIQTFSSYDLPSFKLDDVAKCKLGKEKIAIKSIGIHSWYTNQVSRDLLLTDNVSECFQCLKPQNVREHEFGTYLKCLEYCLRDSELVFELFQHEKALDFLIERSNFTALNVEQALYYGNSKYILELFKTYGTNLGYFINTSHFKNTVEEDGQKLSHFFVGKNSSTYQGALNFCTPGTFFKDVYVFDFASMYPSILLNQNLCYGTCSIMNIDEYNALPQSILDQCMSVPYRTHSDEEFLKPNKFPFEMYQHPVVENDQAVIIWYKEERGFLPDIVEHFLKKRKEYKKIDDVIHYNKQLNVKIVLNSIYGCMASMDTSLACIYIAMSITAFARIYLLASAEYFTARGKVVAYSDTDSIFVEKYGLKDGIHVNQYLNQPHMSLAFERVMDYLLVISKKRYIYECKNSLKTKGFEKKSNELIKWMSNNIIKRTMQALKSGERDASEGWKIWVDTLVNAYSMCMNPKKYCITRKTKTEYKSKHCPQLKLLQRYPEKAGQYIDYTYSQADISLKESTKWIMEVEDVEHVNFEKLFISQKKIFITLLNIAFSIPEAECNKVLNAMKWKSFLNAEFKSFCKTGKNIMILVEKGVKYTFQIND